MEVFIPLLAIFFVIGVPVMSIAAHFVLRPMIRDLAKAIRGDRKEAEESWEHRLARLEDMMLEQGRQTDLLIEAEAFRRRLETESATGVHLTPSEPAGP